MVFKNILIILVISLFLIGCAAKEEQTSEAPREVTEPSEEITTTGEGSIDEVATGISDISDIDEELDTSELDDIDSILEDIENI